MLRSAAPLTILLASLMLIVGACASGPPRVVRVAPDAPPHFVHRADARVESLAAQLVGDCVSRPWLRDFVGQHGRAPLVRVLPLRAYGALYVNVNTLSSRIEARLSASARVAVAGAGIAAGAHATAAVSPDVAAELRDQAEHASDQTVKTAQPRPVSSAATPRHADFVLVGRVDGKQVSLSLIDVTRNAKVWIGLGSLSAR